MADYNKSIDLDKGLNKILDKIDSAADKLREKSSDAGEVVGIGFDEGIESSSKQIQASSIKLESSFKKLGEKIKKQKQRLSASIQGKPVQLEVDFSDVDMNSKRIQRRIQRLTDEFNQEDLVNYDTEQSRQQFQDLIALTVKYDEKLSLLRKGMEDLKTPQDALKNLQQQYILVSQISDIYLFLADQTDRLLPSKMPNVLYDSFNLSSSIKMLSDFTNGIETAKSQMDFSEVVTQLKEIKNAINDIKTAFEPLTNALSSENSALHKMLTSSIGDLNTLESKLGEVYQMINTISNKQFNVQNIISNGNTAHDDLEQIRQFRKEAKELYKQVEQLYSVESMETFNVLKGKPGGVEAFLEYQQSMAEFDLSDLAKRIKSRSATSLGIVIDELNEWKKVLLQFNNLRNNVEAGSFNVSQYSDTSSKVRIGNKTTDQEQKKIVDENTIDNNDILNKIKNLSEQVKTELTAIRSKMEETFDFDTLDLKTDGLKSAIEVIYQQFVELQAKINALDLNLNIPTIVAQVDEKDTRKTIVQATDDDSVSASTNKIDAEAQAMQEVATEATQAAQAKEKFANANKEVTKTAEKTSQKVKEEAEKMEEAAGAIVEASDKFDKVKYVEDVDGAPISKTTTSTITRENAIETESSYYTRDTNGDLQLSTVTLVRDFKKRAAELKKESDKIALAQKTVDKFISQFESKTAGQASTIKGFGGKDGLQNFKIKNLDDIETATQAMLDLDNEYNKITKNFRQGTKSMNPFVNAITGIDEMGNKITEAEIAFDSLNTKPNKLSKDIAELAPLFATMKSYISTDADGNKIITDIYGLSEAYGKLNVALRKVNSDIKIQKKTDDVGIKSEKEQINAYEKILKAQEKYYNLKKKMVNLDPQSAKGQETLRKLTEAQKEYNKALAEQNKLTVGQLGSIRTSKQQQETELGALQQEHKSKISTEQEEKDLKYVLSLYKEYTDAALSLKKMQSDTDTTGAVHTDKQASAIKAVQEAKEKLLALGIDVNKISESGLLTEKQINALLEERAKYQKQIQNIEDTANDKVATKESKQVQRENKQNQNYGKTIYNREARYYDRIGSETRNLEDEMGLSGDFVAKIEKYKAAFKELQDLRDQFANDPNAFNDAGLKNQFQDSALGVEKLRKEILATFKESQKLASLSEEGLLGQGTFDASKFKNASAAMIDFAATVTNGQFRIEGFNSSGTEMYGVIDRGVGVVEKVTVSLDEATGALYAYQNGTRQATNSWNQLGDSLKSGAKQLVSMYFGFHEAIQAVRKGLTYVKEIDLALTELKKVTEATDETYSKFLKNASATSSVIGSTISDFTDATAAFARLGYSIEESSKMAETAIVYKNVADGLDTVEESTESIISTMKAYGIEADDTMGIIDRFNAVGKLYCPNYIVICG